MKKQTARELAFRLLYNCRVNGAFSNLAFDSAIEKSGLSSADRRFAAALSYGTLERLVTIDRIIEGCLKRPALGLDEDIRCVLQLGVYQLLFMDSVPDSAAVNESVKLVKSVCRARSAAGLVNAVLRSLLRSGKAIPEGKDYADTLSIKYSCPRWLVEKWLDEYSEQQTMSLLESSLGKPPVTLRVNTLRCTREELIEKLSAEGIDAEKSSIAENAVNLLSGGAIEYSKAFAEGLFHVQDLASQLCCEALELSCENTLIDVCAAPGGKSFTCAEIMGGRGQIFSLDLHEKRVSLIRNGAERLGLRNITAFANDAKAVNPNIKAADRVLCDVPCSGLGVIRRKPEIKYKDPADLSGLPEIQLQILTASAGYVAVGGLLVYSTCTVSRAENERVVESFLKGNGCFEPVNVSERIAGMNKPFVTLTPDMFGSDGFFIAKLRRVR